MAVSVAFGVVLGVWLLWLAQSVWLAYTMGLVRARTYGPGPAERPALLPDLVIRIGVDVSRFEAAFRQLVPATQQVEHRLDAMRYAFRGIAGRP